MTSVDDRDMFVLCGHERSMCDSTPNCCFTGNCGKNSSLRLRCLWLGCTLVSNAAIAGVLTHVLTVKDIRPGIETGYAITSAICQIDAHREKCGMPRQRLELTHLMIPDDIEDLKTVLDTCPKLRYLYLNMADDDNKREKILADSDLDYLKEIAVGCDSTKKLLTEDWIRFWNKRGHQLLHLNLLQCHNETSDMGSRGYVSFERNNLRNIISMCPNLTNLSLPRMRLSESESTKPSSDFPYLGNLKKLDVEGIYGNPVLAAAEQFEIIAAATNVRVLTLENCASEEVVFDFIKQHGFPFLKILRILTSDDGHFYKCIGQGRIALL